VAVVRMFTLDPRRRASKRLPDKSKRQRNVNRNLKMSANRNVNVNRHANRHINVCWNYCESP
jgi:hypothetical protein